MMVFVFSSHRYCDGARLFQGWLNLPVGSGKLIPWFALHACAAFASLMKQLYLKPQGAFLHFDHLILSAVPLGIMCGAQLLSGIMP